MLLSMEESETFLGAVHQQDYDDLKRKYDRLKESHRKLLRLNQNLEEKLLHNMSCYESEKCSLIHTIKSLDAQLDKSRHVNQKLRLENERFKLDISVAIQLLHCKPSSFSSCKLDNLPSDIKSEVKCHLQKECPRSEKKAKVIHVPNSSFPSTTIIYSVTSGDDRKNVAAVPTTVPASAVVQVLEERHRELYVSPQSSRCPKKDGKNNVIQPPAHQFSKKERVPKFIDHGTQTYPIFIGDTDKTRNTCIYCQGSSIPVQNPPSHQCLAESFKGLLSAESETPSQILTISKLQTNRRNLRTTAYCKASHETEI